MFNRLKQLFGGDSAEKTLHIQGKRMPYLEINVAESAGQPLLIGVHGFGANEAQMKTLVNVAPDLPHTYIAPRALQKHPTGGYMWFPIDVSNGDLNFDMGVVSQTLDTLDAFIAAAIDRYQADPDRVIFVGYSQGGMLAFSYLLRHPQRIAASVALAGSLVNGVKGWADAGQLRDKGLFIGYGTRDPFVSQADMLSAKMFFTDHGVDVSYNEYAIPHVVSQSEVQDVEQWLKPYLRTAPYGD